MTTPHPIFTTEPPEGGFISGVFLDRKEAHAYATEHGHNVGFHHATFPLYYIESSLFRRLEIEGYATNDTLSDYLDAFVEHRPEGDQMGGALDPGDDFALVTRMDGPWTPPEGQEGTDYMGALPHVHLTWGDLDRYEAGESPKAVLGFRRSGIQEADSWWYTEVEQPQEPAWDDEESPVEETEEVSEPLTRDDVRRFIAKLAVRYMKSEDEVGETAALLDIIGEIDKLRAHS